MRSYDGTVILLTRHDDGGLQKSVSCPRAVVSANEVVVCLTLDSFEGAEEDGGAKGILAEAKCPASEYAL